MNRFSLSFTVVFFLFISSVSAFYADVGINVLDSGEVFFEGLTNHPLLKGSSNEFTSKKGSYWVLNISLDEVFSNYIFNLELPKDANINYLKTGYLSRIEHTPSAIRIIGTGENQKFVVVVQYSVGNVLSGSNRWVYILSFMIMVFAVLAFLFFRKKKVCYNFDALTDRQKLIVKFLIKSKKPLTQAFLEKQTKLPKSSLSRNIDSLVKKNIVVKEQRGMSNIVYLKK